MPRVSRAAIRDGRSTMKAGSGSSGSSGASDSTAWSTIQTVASPATGCPAASARCSTRSSDWPGRALGGALEADLHLVVDRRHPDPGGGGQRRRLALVERRRRRRMVADAPAHQQEVHRQAWHLLPAQRHGVAREAVADVEPVIAEAAFRLLHDRQRPPGLERALQDQGGGLAGRMAVPVRRDRHDARRRPRPGHGRIAGGEQVHPHQLLPADLVLRFQLDEVDPGLGHREMQPGRSVRCRWSRPARPPSRRSPGCRTSPSLARSRWRPAPSSIAGGSAAPSSSDPTPACASPSSASTSGSTLPTVGM